MITITIHSPNVITFTGVHNVKNDKQTSSEWPSKVLCAENWQMRHLTFLETLKNCIDVNLADICSPDNSVHCFYVSDLITKINVIFNY